MIADCLMHLVGSIIVVLLLFGGASIVVVWAVAVATAVVVVAVDGPEELVPAMAVAAVVVEMSPV